MRLYHYKNEESPAAPRWRDGDETGSFFNSALTDYIEKSGRRVPAPLLGGGSPAIGKGAYGKPFFSDPWFEGIFFSLAHTRGYLLLCFSDGETGVDCENTAARPGIDSRYARIAERCFTDDELAYVAAGTGGRAGAAGIAGITGIAGAAGTAGAVMRFFEIWTAKEAYMKYTGKGFAEGFKSFSVFGVPGVGFETGRLDGAPHVVYTVCNGRERGVSEA